MQRKPRCASTRTQALSDHLTDTTIAPMTDVTTTTVPTTTAIIAIAAVIEQEDTGLAKIAAAGQNTSSPPLVNLVPSITMTSSTKRYSTACALFTRMSNTR